MGNKWEEGGKSRITNGRREKRVGGKSGGREERLRSRMGRQMRLEGRGRWKRDCDKEWEEGSATGRRMGRGKRDWEKNGKKEERLGEEWEEGRDTGRRMGRGKREWEKNEKREERLEEEWEEGRETGRRIRIGKREWEKNEKREE